MKTQIVLLIILTIAFTSCKVIPRKGYNYLLNGNKKCKIDEVELTNNQFLRVNDETKFELKLTDSVLIYNESVYSNYKVFSFEADLFKEYEITVSSLCDCLGFNKFMFIPELMVFNQQGEIVESRLETSHFGGEGSRPMSLIRKWHILPNSNCNIILYSNNEKLQEKVYNAIASNPTYVHASYVPMYVGMIKSSLVGKFYIKIEEKTVHNTGS